MKNAMIKITTKATAAMLVAATVFTTVAPTVYAAENTAITEETESAGEENGESKEWYEQLTDEQWKAIIDGFNKTMSYM